MPQTVLLADDNVAVQKLVEVTLQKEGYEVVTSDNGLSALDLALKETPNLILADYCLEGLDIISFVKKAKEKERLSNVPILLLVTSNDHYDSSQLESAGIQAFIKKPIDSKFLVDEVNQRISSDGQTSAASDASSAAPDDKPSDDNLSREEEMRIEELLGWNNSGSQSPGADDTPVSEEDESALSLGTHGDSLTEQAVEPSLEETQYFQPPPILGEEKASEEAEAPQDEMHQLHRLQDEPSLSSVLSEMESEVEEPHSIGDGAQKEPGKTVQEAVEKALGEKLPDMAKSSLSPEAITSIIEKVVWDVVPSLAEIEIKKEMKRLKADEG